MCCEQGTAMEQVMVWCTSGALCYFKELFAPQCFDVHLALLCWRLDPAFHLRFILYFRWNKGALLSYVSNFVR